VNLWRPTHFQKGVDFLTNNAFDYVFTGITADLGVRDTDASILKLSYKSSQRSSTSTLTRSRPPTANPVHMSAGRLTGLLAGSGPGGRRTIPRDV
jgi:hypothetical protein